MHKESLVQERKDDTPPELSKNLSKALEGRFFGEEAERVNDAISFALALHNDQPPRPDGPYVRHIVRVVERVVRFGGDAHMVIAAALHDSVEEHAEALAAMAEGATAPSRSRREQAFAYLQGRFGEEPCRIVQAVTNMDKALEPNRSKRNARYAAQLAEKIRDPKVFIVKLSDFLDNGLSLAALEDEALRYRLARKYLPIYPLFISHLEESDVPLSREVAETIREGLQGAWVVARSIVDAVDGQDHKEAAQP